MGILALQGINTSKSLVDITACYQFYGKYLTMGTNSKSKINSTNKCELVTKESFRDQEQREKDGLFNKW